MTSREKLIELLTGYSIDTKNDVEYVVDHLIENGVIVLPCKTNDDVYIPMCEQIFPFYITKLLPQKLLLVLSRSLCF